MLPRPKALVIRAAGSNTDVETVNTFVRAGAEAEALHINRLIESPGLLPRYDIVCVPGGFSYGDDIGSGVVFAHQLRGHLRPALESFLDKGGLMLGVCNGFQVLLKSGLLTATEGHFEEVPSATLTWNRSARYEDRWVRLVATGGLTPWLPENDLIEFPVRHAEGRFVTRDAATLRRLDDNGQLVLHYADKHGKHTDSYPANPNGSEAAIAGICSQSGQVLGLMPHPEAHTYHWHHPEWTRRTEQPDEGDGMRLFRAGVAAVRDDDALRASVRISSVRPAANAAVKA